MSEDATAVGVLEVHKNGIAIERSGVHRRMTHTPRRLEVVCAFYTPSCILVAFIQQLVCLRYWFFTIGGGNYLWLLRKAKRKMLLFMLRCKLRMVEQFS